MRPTRSFRPAPDSPRLALLRRSDRTELWTETVGREPSVYGERWTESDGRPYRSFEPTRSKLSAAIVKEWSGPVPAPGEAWLYLGAASGTTASHVADLAGPTGRVYALERSLRPFSRLLSLAERWPNLIPILGDAREPTTYGALVPPVRGVYADIAQADQVEIALTNAAHFLEGNDGCVLLALKTASMGRDATAVQHVRRAEEEMAQFLDLEPSVRLDPFHRGHYFLGGTVRAGRLPGAVPTGPPPLRERSRERRRR
ncbi:MAG: fibrillarin-like rRNA/tRNA 2'-O-methyltransferase [Thermoplasmata archaeon]|nr:fibrillarin-like rRNA/tRNA 2'-O-methyltransferase [Thermoplasmata archaeon]